MNNLYESDFYAWANQQAALLRSGHLSEADIENIAEEIETMGRSEKRELINRLQILLMHLLKWQFQPTRRGTSWQLTIREQRIRLREHLKDNPSLKHMLDDSIESAFLIAVLSAANETGLDTEAFPKACPYSFSQMVDDNFWPE